jgi:hypothetical protein
MRPSTEKEKTQQDNIIESTFALIGTMPLYEDCAIDVASTANLKPPPMEDKTDEELNDSVLLDPGMQCLLPHPDPEFYFKHHPIYCCLQYLKLVIDLEEVTVELANKHETLVPLAHLYNASRQTKVLQESWPAFDAFIATHTDHIFRVGKELPKTDAEIVRRSALRAGMPTEVFQRTFPTDRIERPKISPRWPQKTRLMA